jgi:hypothetical protein
MTGSRGRHCLMETAVSENETQTMSILPFCTPPVACRLDVLRPLAGAWSARDAFAGFSVVTNDQMIGHLVLLDDTGNLRLNELWIFKQEGDHVRLHYKLFDGALNALQDKDQWRYRYVVGAGSSHINLENITLIFRDEEFYLIAHVGPDRSKPRRLDIQFWRGVACNR